MAIIVKVRKEMTSPLLKMSHWLLISSRIKTSLLTKRPRDPKSVVLSGGSTTPGGAFLKFPGMFSTVPLTVKAALAFVGRGQGSQLPHKVPSSCTGWNRPMSHLTFHIPETPRGETWVRITGAENLLHINMQGSFCSVNKC